MDLAPKKRKNWRDEDMCGAIHAVKYDQLNISNAEKIFSVPWKTLGDRRVTHGTKPGLQPYLKKEETKFSEFLVDMAKPGYGKSRKQVKTISENVAQDKGMLGTDETFSNG